MYSTLNKWLARLCLLFIVMVPLIIILKIANGKFDEVIAEVYLGLLAYAPLLFGTLSTLFTFIEKAFLKTRTKINLPIALTIIFTIFTYLFLIGSFVYKNEELLILTPLPWLLLYLPSLIVLIIEFRLFEKVKHLILKSLRIKPAIGWLILAIIGGAAVIKLSKSKGIEKLTSNIPTEIDMASPSTSDSNSTPSLQEQTKSKKVYDKNQVEAIVKQIIIDQLGVDAREVTNEACFIDDLGADSVDTVEFVMAFEEEFDIEIPDEEAEKLKTVGDAIDYLFKKAAN